MPRRRPTPTSPCRRDRTRRRLAAARAVVLAAPTRTVLHGAPVAVADRLDEQAIARRYRRRGQVERVDGERCRSSRRRAATAATSCCATRSARRAPPRRHAAQRRGRCCRPRRSLRHRLDAWRLRRPAHHRQHDVPQALFRLARPLQHHARQRPAHPGRSRRRMAAARRALGLRNGPLRLPLDLPVGERTITVSAIVSSEEPAMQWRVTRRRRALPLPRLRPSRPRRA